jgi:GntR family transcriptional regulator, transcriptional repressor for pyruvate dehydrogenase complex
MIFDRTPVPQTVARKIQSMILEGKLGSGKRIPSQRDMAEEMGVSRASLREALLTLETLGIVRTEPGRGTFVTGKEGAAASHMAPWRYADSYSVQDVFETRLMIEGRIAGLAAGHLDADDLALLEKATDDMERCWAAQDLLANVEADLLFHVTIARRCRNAMMATLYETVRSLLTETQRQPIPITEPARMRSSIAEHRALIAALRRRDPQAAQIAMEAHIRNTAACAGISI